MEGRLSVANYIPGALREKRHHLMISVVRFSLICTGVQLHQNTADQAGVASLTTNYGRLAVGLNCPRRHTKLQMPDYEGFSVVADVCTVEPLWRIVFIRLKPVPTYLPTMPNTAIQGSALDLLNV